MVVNDFGELGVDASLISATDTSAVPIATGSSPLVPPIRGLDNVPFETNETLFDLREKPAHLLIIGGGPIGMEMAQAHIRMGCEVTVIEGDKALAKDDPEMAKIVLQTLRDEGIVIEEGGALVLDIAKVRRLADETGVFVWVTGP